MRQSEGGPAPRRRTVSAAPPKPAARKPAAKKPAPGKPPTARTAPKPAAGSAAAGGSRFEELHARDEGGKFTSGADLNRGQRERQPTGRRRSSVQRGSQGGDVAQLQRLLRMLGYDDSLNDDGKFGPDTLAALRRAQRNLGVEDEDGYLGPKTRAALRDELRSVTPDESLDEDGTSGRRRKGRKGRRSASRSEGTSPAQMERYRDALREWAKAVQEWAKKQAHNQAGVFPPEPPAPGKAPTRKREVRVETGSSGRKPERPPRPTGPPRHKDFDGDETKDWDPTDHPRDNRGRFAGMGREAIAAQAQAESQEVRRNWRGIEAAVKDEDDPRAALTLAFYERDEADKIALKVREENTPASVINRKLGKIDEWAPKLRQSEEAAARSEKNQGKGDARIRKLLAANLAKHRANSEEIRAFLDEAVQAIREQGGDLEALGLGEFDKPHKSHEPDEVKLRDVRWDPAKHPRAPDGSFTEVSRTYTSAGVPITHLRYNSPKAEESIRKLMKGRRLRDMAREELAEAARIIALAVTGNLSGSKAAPTGDADMERLAALILADLEAMAARDEDLDVGALIAKYRDAGYGGEGKADPATLEHKTLYGSETKVLDDELGIVEAIVSVTGVKDLVNDIIEPGAYKSTLERREPLGFRNHDPNRLAAYALEIKELLPGDPRLPGATARGLPWPSEAGGLYVKSRYNLDTSVGREAFSDVKFFGSRLGWSIGYHVPRTGARLDHKAGTRQIKSLDLFEWSDVPHGANNLTGTLGTKGLLVLGDPGGHLEAGELSELEILHNESLWQWVR